MERDKNMTKIFKFVYAMILFSFLFLVEKNVVRKLFFILFKLLFYFFTFLSHFSNISLSFLFITAYIIECKTDNDCPISQLKMYAWKCVKNGCHLFDVIPMMYE